MSTGSSTYATHGPWREMLPNLVMLLSLASYSSLLANGWHELVARDKQTLRISGETLLHSLNSEKISTRMDFTNND